MKLKYYLRGLGIGIVVTMVLLAITLRGKQTPMTDDEIRARAKELGMEEKYETDVLASGVSENNGKEAGKDLLADAGDKKDKPAADKAETNKTEPDKAEPDKAEPDKTEADKAEPDKAEADKAEVDKAEADKTESDKAETDKAEQDKAQADKSEQSGSDKEQAEQIKQEIKDDADKAVADAKKDADKAADKKQEIKDDAEKAADKKQEIKDNADKSAAEAKEQAEQVKEDAAQQKTITVNGGDDSLTICRRMKEAGLIQDAQEFDSFLCKNGYDRRICSGKHTFKTTDSKEEMAKKLVSRGE